MIFLKQPLTFLGQASSKPKPVTFNGLFLDSQQPSALTKADGRALIICPAVAARVTAASSKMQFGQEEELVRHGADRIGDGPSCIAPVDSYPLAFKYRVIGEIRARGLVVVIRQEGEQAVWVGITVPKLHDAMIGGEALDGTPCRCMFRNDPQEDVVMHEPVHWRRVARVAVHQDTKVVTPVVAVWRDQCVGLFVLPTVLQLQENSFSLGEKSIDDSLGIRPGSEGSREKREATTP